MGASLEVPAALAQCLCLPAGITVTVSPPSWHHLLPDMLTSLCSLSHAAHAYEARFTTIPVMRAPDTAVSSC